MKPQQILEIADFLSKDLNKAPVLRRERRGKIQIEYGVDNNQIHSMMSYLVMRKTRGDTPENILKDFRELVLALPKSGFIHHSNKSPGQFREASRFVSELLNCTYHGKRGVKLDTLEDLIDILGWTARLMPFHEMLNSFGTHI